MTQCLSLDPSARPTAEQLVRRLEAMQGRSPERGHQG
jgi:hypothetical protein